MALSIRWRLTLLNTLALAVLLVGFGALVYSLLARAVVGSVDGKLLECRRQLEREPRTAEDPARLKYFVEEFWEHEQVAAAVYDANSQLLMRTDELIKDAIPPAPTSEPGSPHFQSTQLPTLGRQRVITMRLPNASDGRSLVLTASLADADQTMMQLGTVMLTAVPIMLMVSAVVAYALAARALAPLQSLVHESRSITAQSLDRRLPITNPHDELGHLAATINDMVGRLERSFTEMKRFTADASHELRTPLAVIRAETEAALGRAGEEEVQQMLGSALEECSRLSRLTDQLLTLARQDAGLLEQRSDPVNLAYLAASVLETLRPLAEAKALVLAVEPGARMEETVIRGDPDRLRQVLLNVLDNSLKHTATGSVTLRLKSVEKEVIIEVRDTGEGIPPEHLPHVFERFYRVDKARTREQGGTGLGLSIAKSIIDAHGGRIDLHSTPPQGTTCVITLPRSAA